MPPTNDPGAAPADPDLEVCLARTRSAVLNILVGVGLLIAASGWSLRRHAEKRPFAASRNLHDGLLFGLIVVAVCSYMVRRIRLRGSDGEDRSRRTARFFWTHVGSAAVAAVGVVLGFVYGWYVNPRLEGVIAFWVVPMALGFLALPRRGELDDLGPSPPSPEAPPT